MNWRGMSLAMAALVAGWSMPAPAQANGGNGDASLMGRPGVSAGMGVCYISAPDLVDLVNATPGAVERLSQFKAAVDFFGIVSVPITPDWVLKLEYSYVLSSYNIETQYGTVQNTVVMHMPTLIAQYLLVDRGIYNVKIGAGAGYHIGVLEEQFISENFSAGGLGFVLDLEANTAFGEHVYVYLGGDLRWDLIGDLKTSTGNSPGGTTFQPTLHLFGAGARLGFTYYF